MLTDATLAILHHVLVFALFSMLTAELMLVRPGLAGDALKRLGGIDGAYGGIALSVLVVGAARLVWGAKGWDYYAANPWFWAKIATFLLVGVLSVPPTMRYVAWRKAHSANAAHAVPAAEISRVRALIHAQLGLLILLPVFAALMARY